jgi:hypothetical protein
MPRAWVARGRCAPPEADRMIRFFLIVIVAGIVLALLGLGFLGLFPPHPAIHHVATVLPNTRFASH